VNAKNRNASERALFLSGGSLGLLLYGISEMNRQTDELKTERLQASTVSECPCGCGLQNKVCDEQLERVRLADDELPF
jgi:hypothetical protein